MNMHCVSPTFEALNGESRGDSYLQAISPSKRKKVLDKNFVQAFHKTTLKHIQSNTTSSLKKPWITSSLDSLSDGIKKATENENENCKSSINEMKTKLKKVVKFVPAKVAPIPAENNKKNNKAAIQIQRIARGGWQRIMFRIALLQHKLDTSDERTNVQLQRIKEHTQKRKDKYRKKLELEAAAEDKKSAQQSTLAKESKDIVAYLRKENQKFRVKNEALHHKIQALKGDSGRLDNVNVTTDEHVASLGDQAKQIEETNAKFKTIVPLYADSVAKTREAVEMRQQFCESEHTIRLLYVRAIGTAMTMMEEGCNDTDLVDELFEYSLELEGEENPLPLPPKLGQFVEDELDKSSSASDEDYDELVVA
jgi:hypothetical protein